MHPSVFCGGHKDVLHLQVHEIVDAFQRPLEPPADVSEVGTEESSPLDASTVRPWILPLPCEILPRGHP